ncbi:hypothetical protein Py04_1663 [Pyrococcus sp. ST04]|nr:hypothetical protein Py04_1663 [Pyrococcus sp. ST04]
MNIGKKIFEAIGEERGVKRLILSTFFLILYIIRISFRIAGLVRMANKGRRSFKRALIENGFPKDLADELVEELFPKFDLPSSLNILRFRKIRTRKMHKVQLDGYLNQ